MSRSNGAVKKNKKATGCFNSRTVDRHVRAFRSKPDRYPNVTIKKIPKAVLSRWEWGKDGDSLQVEKLPKAPPPKGQIELSLSTGDAE